MPVLSLGLKTVSLMGTSALSLILFENSEVAYLQAIKDNPWLGSLGLTVDTYAYLRYLNYITIVINTWLYAKDTVKETSRYLDADGKVYRLEQQIVDQISYIQDF